MVNCLVIVSPSNPYTDCYNWPNIVFRANFSIAVPHSVIESMAATSLTVKWDAPVGERTSYIVTLDDGSGSEETKTPDQDSTSAKFTGLTAGKSYTVRLVTVSGSAKVYTRKSNGCLYYELRAKPLMDKNPVMVSFSCLVQAMRRSW